MQDNLYKWTAYLQGPEGTPFEGGCFQVVLDVQVRSAAASMRGGSAPLPRKRMQADAAQFKCAGLLAWSGSAVGSRSSQ